jgi:serine/threonine-protein kinase
MICPRCTIGEIADESGHCALCGFAPVAGVTVQRPVADEVLETVQRELEGRFKIRVLLRHGTRTIVYLAEDAASGQLVALKVIPLQRGMQPDLSRFEREASLAASLTHSHIASVLAFGTTKAMLWYSMDHVKGRSLADVLRESNVLNLETCRSVLEQVASALDYMHRRGVTHGNLKPSNILLDESGWARVSDPCVMGALMFPVQVADKDKRSTSGTPEYMAPEQFGVRAPGASVDQYALAVIAYECLSGNLPFVGDAPDELEQMHRDDRPTALIQSVGGIPAHVSDAVQRALSKMPADRFPSVLDFVAMLRKDWTPGSVEMIVPEGRPTSPSHVFVIEAAESKFKLPKIALASAGLVVVLLAVLLLVRPWVDRPPEPRTVITPPPTAALPEAPQETQPEVQQPPAEETVPARPSPAPTQRVTPPVTQAPVIEPGTLRINSRPWGQVFLDGELVGNTPQVLTIAPGTHSIRIVQEGFEPFDTEIQVASGQQLRLTDIELRARQP